MRSLKYIFEDAKVETNSILNSFDSATFSQFKGIVGNLSTTLKNKGKILICGNGGSACDASHFAEELTGKFCRVRKPLAAIALSDAGHITCVANDFGFDQVFARHVLALGRPEDALICLSTSGNSKNVINAFREAELLGMHTVSLLGKDGGAMESLCQWSIRIASDNTARIQEAHKMLLHLIVEGIEITLFPELNNA